MCVSGVGGRGGQAGGARDKCREGELQAIGCKVGYKDVLYSMGNSQYFVITVHGV